MTPQQWAESIGGAMVAFIGIVALVLAAWRKLALSITELRQALAAIGKQASTAASASTRIDSSLHTTNHGTHVKDFQEHVLRELGEVRKDIGGIREELRGLAEADRSDRAAAAAEHKRIHRRIDGKSKRR